MPCSGLLNSKSFSSFSSFMGSKRTTTGQSEQPPGKEGVDNDGGKWRLLFLCDEPQRERHCISIRNWAGKAGWTKHQPSANLKINNDEYPISESAGAVSETPLILRVKYSTGSAAIMSITWISLRTVLKCIPPTDLVKLLIGPTRRRTLRENLVHRGHGRNHSVLRRKERGSFSGVCQRPEGGFEPVPPISARILRFGRMLAWGAGGAAK